MLSTVTCKNVKMNVRNISCNIGAIYIPFLYITYVTKFFITLDPKIRCRTNVVGIKESKHYIGK